MKKYSIIFIFIFCIASQFVHAQTGSVRGFVYDKETGEPCIFTNVYLKGTKYGAATDVDGYFNMTRIKPGAYVLAVSYLGYDSLSVSIKIEADRIITKKLYIKKSAIMLEESVVSAERQEMKTEIRTSIVKVTPKEIKQIPTVGSEPDLAQYLQVLPGVIFTGDQGGQLYIRGGPPIQNKVLLDGMVIYNPFHSIGLFSVFDSDILRNADIYTGGFGAEFGGRISSIMDIATRDGNKRRQTGKISTSTFGSKLLIEGPLQKAKENSDGSISYILSGKTSYLEQSSKYLYTYIDTGGLPFNFTDLYAKVSFNAKNGSKANFFGFNFSDRVRYQAVSDLNWNSYGIGSNFLVVPTGSPVLIKANMSYSKYLITLEEYDQYPRQSAINGFNFGLTFVYFLGKNELNYGLETLGFKTDFNFYNYVGRHLSQEENTTELAGFIKYKQTIGKLLLEPGFRIQWYASLSAVSPEPRLGLKYNLTDKLRLKFAGGLYSQNLIAANSDRDVVNLFYGFLSGSEDLPKEFDGKTVKTKLQKSQHAIFGFEYDLTNKINVNVESYIKDNIQLSNINRNKIYEDNADNADKPDYLKKDYIIETGSAYGVDFLLKYDYKRTYFWAVYSLGYVTRYDGTMDYYPHFDRRHNVNLVASRIFGADMNWEFSTRWNLGSGFPFTQTLGFYEQVPFEDGISTDYTYINGVLGVIYAGLNEGRLPYYHRLDMTVKRKFYLSTNSVLEATVSVTNIYNRSNIFYFDRIKHERVDQLPFMPSAGLSLTF